MTQRNKRREADVMKLMMSEYQLELVEDRMDEFYVQFRGPKDSPYEGGVWRVHVELPESYPYKSPSIGFVNRIYHPNVDETAGSVCLDVINQTWSPMFDLINVFDVFLPQLLLYPNPTDPLNGEAAALLMREPDAYNKKVQDYVRKYAWIKKDFGTSSGESGSESGSSARDHDMDQMDVENDAVPGNENQNIVSQKKLDSQDQQEQQNKQDDENEYMMDADDDEDDGSFLSDDSDCEDDDEM